MTVQVESARIEVDQIVRECVSVIKHPKDTNELAESLRKLRTFLPGVSQNEPQWNPAQRTLFTKWHYVRVLRLILENLSVEWLNLVPRGQTAVLVDVFFLQGVHHDALLVLCESITSAKSSFQLNKCVSLLESFLQQHCLVALLWQQSVDTTIIAGRPDSKHTPLWNDLVSAIASLPDRVTNKLKKETSDIFYPDEYVSFVTQELITVLKKVRDNLKDSKDTSVAFLSLLCGKLCMVGYGDRLMKMLMQELHVWLKSDWLMVRVCQKLVTGIPSSSLEAAIVPMLKHCKWHGTVDKLLGSVVLTDHQLQFLLTNKMLLVKHYEQDQILWNIIGYLASSHSFRPLLHKVLKSLLTVWSDGSTLKHTSYEQHVYISRAIMVCLAFMQDDAFTQLKQDLLGILMNGVQVHLSSSDPRIRRVGMVIAEAVTGKLNIAGNQLKFEYESDTEVEHLKSLLVVPDEPALEDMSSSVAGMSLKVDVATAGDPVTENKTSNTHQEGPEELDSDDDLEPYDLSNDVKVNKVKKPTYIRDCMEGLICSDDVDTVEACLLVAEPLIKKHPRSVQEVAVEFAKILLHLQKSFALSEFHILRHRAMVALAVTAPVQVAEYLCKEFVEVNYNLTQRMDMLRVLSESAKQLSRPEGQSSGEEGQQVQRIVELDPVEESESPSWQEIVQRRIDSKTRRFAPGPTQPQLPQTPNKFASVAGHFFFPLMKHLDRSIPTLDLLGDDHLVLVQLVHTLGVIIHAAVNTTIVGKMGKALLEFLWALRYHPQQTVRQAVIYCVCMVLLSVPSHILLTDLQDSVMDTKLWLDDITLNDSDKQCQKLAVQALVLMQDIAKQEFGSSGS